MSFKEGQDIIKKLQGEHNHSSQLLRQRVKQLEDELVNNAARNPTLPTRQVMADLSNQLNTESMEASTSMSTTQSLKMRIFRARSKLEDKLPNKADDLMNLSEKYRKLDSGADFLIGNEDLGDGQVLLVFMSDFGKRVLEKSSVWMSDGTFKCVPPQFAQLYVVHGSHTDSSTIFPACFGLLLNKQASTYNRFFEIMKEHLNPGLEPQVYNIDFELAAMSAIREHFPSATIDGCNFHWKKAIFDNVGAKVSAHIDKCNYVFF